MSGSSIGTIVGGAIGFAVGGPLGMQIGMAAGGIVGGIVDPVKTYGPHIGDAAPQSATDGNPIAWVMGTAWVTGTIVDVSKRREVKVKDPSQGKGGGSKSYHYEAHQDFAILVCESDELKGSTIGSVLMVEQDGKIVYDVRPGSTIASDSAKWAQGVTFYYGGESQMPPAKVEAIHGAGNNPAYRGALLAVFNDFNLTPAGGRIPTFRFLVVTTGDPGTLTTQQLASGRASYYWKLVLTIPAPIRGSAGTFRCGVNGTAPIKFRVTYAGKILIDTGYIGNPDDQADMDAEINYLRSLEGIWWPQPFPDGIITSGSSVSAPVTFSDSEPTITLEWWDPLLGSRSANIEAYIDYLSVTGKDVLTLDEAVGAVSTRGGVTSIDASPLNTVTVIGYGINAQTTAVGALGPLLGTYFAYGSEYDAKIHFDFYGKDAVMTIDEDDIVEANDANDDAVTRSPRNNATEFPRRIIGQYYDPAQNYMPATVMQTRRAAGVTATGDKTLSMPVALDADTAQQVVDKALKVAYAQLEGTTEFSVPFAGKVNVYLSLVSGDAVLFRGKRWIVQEMILSDLYIKLTLLYDRQSAYTSNVEAIPGVTPAPPSSRYSGPTKIVPMNLPKLQSQDAAGIYFVVYSDPHNDAWRTADVQMSLDDGATWQSVASANVDSTVGALTAADTGDSLTVQVNDDLSSVGPAQLDARQNAAVLLQGAYAEVLQFGTATEDPDTEHLYVLTDLRRAQVGSVEVNGEVGDQFVSLDAVQLVPIDTSFAGTTIKFRAVGSGEDAADAVVASVVYQPDSGYIISGGTTGDGLPPPGG